LSVPLLVSRKTKNTETIRTRGDAVAGGKKELKGDLFHWSGEENFRKGFH